MRPGGLEDITLEKDGCSGQSVLGMATAGVY